MEMMQKEKEEGGEKNPMNDASAKKSRLLKYYCHFNSI